MENGQVRPGQHSAATCLLRITLILLPCAISVYAQPNNTPANKKPKANPASSSIERYLDRVRQENLGAPASPGSIWSDNGRLARLSSDVRAFRRHDLIAVVVSESMAASTDGTVKGSRASTANSQIAALFGKLSTASAAQNLVSQNSAATLNGQGQSVTNSSLSTVFGGEVVEVLPNGTLVVEAARQVEFNQQTQIFMLRGLVRPEDVSAQNQVLSTAISSLELEVRGRGIVDDFTHRPNPIVRALLRLLIF
jgi:flagellar L-ring protein FlgH